jgi:hypothetical protein
VQTIHGVSIQGRGERRVSQVILEKLDIIQYEKDRECETKEEAGSRASSPRAASRGAPPAPAPSKRGRGSPKIYTAALDTVVLSKLERFNSERSLARINAPAETPAPGEAEAAGAARAAGATGVGAAESSSSAAAGSADGFEVVQKSAVERMQIEMDAEARAVSKQKSLTERILARAREREQSARGRSAAGEPEAASPAEATTPRLAEEPAQGARWRAPSRSLGHLARHTCLPCLAFVCLKKGPQPETDDD